MAKSSHDFAHDMRPLARWLNKPPAEFTRADLTRYCLECGVAVVNFHYPSIDGKLKELRLPVRDAAYLDRILAAGERVDGSSLFPGVLDTSASDLYVVPVYRWAFANPWTADELDIVCRFADHEGRPCALTPDNLLDNLHSSLKSECGAELRALTELEFYMILDREDERFTGRPQRNYHQSAPYLHGRGIADEILRVVSQVTGLVKYCHSEVGYIDKLDSPEPELDGKRVEQYELEFDLMPVDDLACWTAVARWIIRVVADRHGQSVTFLPKLDEDMAGSGLHVHLALYRDGANVMYDSAGLLSDDALKLVGGVLRHAPELTGFGNSVAASYLRLVPHQEAPTRVCWGDRNRSGLIRVPLAFGGDSLPGGLFNPGTDAAPVSVAARPTVEFRSPDGSAFTYLLLAAITACVRDGLTDADSAEFARNLQISGNLFEQPKLLKKLNSLPAHAVEAADVLARGRKFFEQSGFPPQLIDVVIGKLRDEDDDQLSEKIRELPAVERLRQSRRVMHKDLHKH